MSQPFIYREQPARRTGSLRPVPERRLIRLDARNDVPAETPASSRELLQASPPETNQHIPPETNQRIPPETNQHVPAETNQHVPAGTSLNSVERDLINILDSAPQYGETIEVSFRRKEAELRTVFAALPVLDARALQTRLANPRVNDAVAVRFSRLVADRRARLLTFLADARRRAALAGRR
jgi:hypothetical protein